MNHSISYIVGMLSGIAAVFLFVLVIRLLCRRHQSISKILSPENTYDERQILARGKAYQTAFIVLVGYVLAASCLDEFFLLSSAYVLWWIMAWSVSLYFGVCMYMHPERRLSFPAGECERI